METGASRHGLNVEDMGSLYIPVPPINELNEIVRYLKESFSKINIAIRIHQRQM
jgi:restriction endonuclease S subunit